MENKRPAGIIVLAILFLILAIPGLGLAFIAFVSGSNIKGPWDLLVDIFMRILFIATPIVLIVSAGGLLCLDRWSRPCAIITAIVLSIVWFIYGIQGLLYDPKANMFFSSFCFTVVLLFIISIFYLTRPKVKDQFR